MKFAISGGVTSVDDDHHHHTKHTNHKGQQDKLQAEEKIREEVRNQ